MIGLLHHSFWMGDILSIYAVFGFFLLPIPRLCDRALLLVGILLILNVPGRFWDIINFLFVHIPNPDQSDIIAEQYSV
ncbi:hypothetical protein BH10BAC3_BH10BAC3_20490 [soil metagenome]